MKIQYNDNPTLQDIEYISESLFEYNCSNVGKNDFKKLVIELRNDDNKLCGGIVGWSRWDWAHIDNLWIKEEYRGNGFGYNLLHQFEHIAKQRECKFIDLDTFNFQAPEFYRKNGYNELFVIRGIANGTEKYFFKKTL